MKRICVLIVMMMSLVGFVAFAQDDKPANNKEAKPAEGKAGEDRNQGGPRNFDPQKMQQMMMDRIKENLGASDEDWKTIKPLLEKVMTLSRDSRSMGGMMSGMRRRSSEAEGADSKQPVSEITKATNDLKAILDKDDATAEDIKTATQALRDARKKSQEKLVKAKAELIEKLTPSQEARLVMMGILD